MQAEALGEPSEDPLLLFSVLYAFWNHTNGDAMRDLAAQFLVRAHRVTVPLMTGHRMMGVSLSADGAYRGGPGAL